MLMGYDLLTYNISVLLTLYLIQSLATAVNELGHSLSYCSSINNLNGLFREGVFSHLKKEIAK